MTYLVRLFIFCLFSYPVYANQELNPNELEKQQLEKWFYEDAPTLEKEVNEGQLDFLEAVPTKPTLHSINFFIIDETSIDQGWVKLTQCYENLDAVPVAEVVYQYRFMRKLKIKSTKNILHAKVSGQSVQLEDIQKNARLCITAEVRNFYQNEDKSFSLVNGPYHRKFLDGYFPYHLSMEIQFANQLHFVNSSPQKQKGFDIKETKNKLKVDTLFEGKLNTEFRFKLIK